MSNTQSNMNAPSMLLQQTHAGRVRAPEIPTGDRVLASTCHLSSLIGIFIWPALFFPLFLCIFSPGKTLFVTDHAREALNAQISLILVSVLLAVTLIGILLIPVVLVIYAVNLIRGSVMAAEREFFRYPMAIRILPAPSI